MFESQKAGPRSDNFSKDALDQMLELEQNTSDEIKSQRAHERISVRCRTTARPGNMSQREDHRVEGISGDISGGGCLVLFPRPMNVGDIYWVVFDRNVLDIGPQLAICKRCRCVREDAYESGFMFFQTVDLANVVKR